MVTEGGKQTRWSDVVWTLKGEQPCSGSFVLSLKGGVAFLFGHSRGGRLWKFQGKPKKSINPF